MSTYRRIEILSLELHLQHWLSPTFYELCKLPEPNPTLTPPERLSSEYSE